jgi:hypothetical protein
VKIYDFDNSKANLCLEYDEVYTILQCIAQVRDFASDTDIEAIIGLTRKELSSILDEVFSLKEKMRTNAK